MSPPLELPCMKRPVKSMRAWVLDIDALSLQAKRRGLRRFGHGMKCMYVYEADFLNSILLL